MSETMTPRMIELMALVAAEDAEREREEREAAEAWQARQTALIAEVQALAGEVLSPCRIEPSDDGIDTFTVAPDMWHGLVTFRMWRVNGKWYCGNGRSPGYRADWNEPDAARFLVELHRRFEERRESEIAFEQNFLTETLVHSQVARSLTQLFALAPERAAEWNSAGSAALARINQREAAVDAYVAALAAWRREYEATLEDNRAAVAEIQAMFDDEFTRREVCYTAVGVDEDGEAERWRETVWAFEDVDVQGYWSVFDHGDTVKRRIPGILWIGRPITQRLSEAGEGPWRKTVYAGEAGLTVYCLPVYAARSVRDQLDRRMRPLPVEPTPGRFGLGGGEWTVEERQRINAVTGGMVSVDIPF